jgi:hypothetical protein
MKMAMMFINIVIMKRTSPKPISAERCRSFAASLNSFAIILDSV